jgi:hypothetical protein
MHLLIEEGDSVKAESMSHKKYSSRFNSSCSINT